MAELEPEGRLLQPVCLLLIFGIPGSGKTLLTRSILNRVGEQHQTDLRWVAIHFDDFYPPDSRSKSGYVSGEPFDLKEARRELQSGLEMLLTNNMQKVAQQEVTTIQPHDTKHKAKATELMRYMNSQVPLFDDTGRLILRLRLEGKYQHPIVFILDDNMPLRSMRHEYYKMARKYKMSFAQVCVKCSPSVALARNSLRTTPIPNPTIIAMEESLEAPNPAQHHWERRSCVLNNDTEGKEFLVKASESILSLVRESLANPVLPTQQIDAALQEASRAANFKSCIHQADNILRKCVSSTLQNLLQGEVTAGEVMAEMARKANLARKEILQEVQSGVVTCQNKRWEGLDYKQLQATLEKKFGVHLHKLDYD